MECWWRSCDENSNRTSYAYDADNQLTQTEDALTHLSTLAYDADGNVTASTDARGFTTTYAYDALDRLTQSPRVAPVNGHLPADAAPAFLTGPLAKG
jgi:YD repeat-containing protein